MKTMSTQAGGDHYQKRAIQPIEYIQANDLGYEEGNVVKYVTRHADKGGAEDLQKAIQYLRFLLENEYDVLSEINYESDKSIAPPLIQAEMDWFASEEAYKHRLAARIKVSNEIDEMSEKYK